MPDCMDVCVTLNTHDSTCHLGGQSLQLQHGATCATAACQCVHHGTHASCTGVHDVRKEITMIPTHGPTLPLECRRCLPRYTHNEDPLAVYQGAQSYPFCAGLTADEEMARRLQAEYDREVASHLLDHPDDAAMRRMVDTAFHNSPHSSPGTAHSSQAAAVPGSQQGPPARPASGVAPVRYPSIGNSGGSACALCRHLEVRNVLVVTIALAGTVNITSNGDIMVCMAVWAFLPAVRKTSNSCSTVRNLRLRLWLHSPSASIMTLLMASQFVLNHCTIKEGATGEQIDSVQCKRQQCTSHMPEGPHCLIQVSLRGDLSLYNSSHYQAS